MALTAFEQLRQALVTVLMASASIPDGEVIDGRAVASTIDKLVEIDVQMADAKSTRNLAGANAPVDWDTDYVIEVRVRAATGDKPDALIEARMQAVNVALAALSITGLGVVDVDTDARWRWRNQAATAQQSAPRAVAQRLVRISHRTLGADLAPAP